MKKLICICIFVLTLCILTACSTTEELPENTEDSTVQTVEPKTSKTQVIVNNEEPQKAGGIDNIYAESAYNMDFYGIESSFSELVERAAYEEWLDSCGFYDRTAAPEDISILAFIRYFNIPKEDFKKANTPPPEFDYDEYAVYTDEQIDALYSNDKTLLAQYFMNPNAINVGGEIYPPIWFTEHNLEEVQAAGITKEVLEKKYDDWVFAFSEASNICQKTKEILDAWNEETSEETTAEK